MKVGIVGSGFVGAAAAYIFLKENCPEFEGF
jgi:glycine/D-amino acid oxidase-like deaminating enzyme